MAYSRTDALVDTEWLAEHLDAPDVKVIDATFLWRKDMSEAKRNFQELHIPGARFFDIDDIADTSNPLPHMLPRPEKFSSRARALGLGDGIRIVAYDQNGGAMAAARAWWMFRVFGHKDVAVLNGGLPKWLAENRPTGNCPGNPTPRHFTARINNMLVRDKDQMLKNLDTRRDQVVDARNPERFSGKIPEPREGLKSGHIPGSANLPFTKLMDPDNHFTLRSAEDIKKAFNDAGVDLSNAVAASCGSGVTACVVALAAYMIGKEDVSVYDGSWTEWGSAEDTPIETGR